MEKEKRECLHLPQTQRRAYLTRGISFPIWGDERIDTSESERLVKENNFFEDCHPAEKPQKI